MRQSTVPARPVQTPGYARLRLVADSFDQDRTVSEVASEAGLTRQRLYQLRDQAAEALAPRAPGPVVGALMLPALEQRVTALEIQLSEATRTTEALRAQLTQTVMFDDRQQRRLELVLASQNVSLTGTQAIFNVLDPMHAPPSRKAVRLRLESAGRVCRDLLRRAREQQCGRIQWVMADDIFFAGCAVKVVADPYSMTVWNVGRWRWHEAPDWALWLEEYKALLFVISDNGTDLVGAAKMLSRPHQVDPLHEKQWWANEVFAPLSRAEHAAREELLAAQKLRESAYHTAQRRKDDQLVQQAAAGRRQAEQDFFAAVRAQDLLFELLCPWQSNGRSWDDGAVEAVLTRVSSEVATIGHTSGARVRKHVTKYGPGYAVHRLALERLESLFLAPAGWRLRDLEQLLDWERTRDNPRGSVNSQTQAGRLAARLRARMESDGVKVQAALDALLRYQQWTPRSSSGVESLNSQFRVVQMVHRTVSDEMLWLRALAWNLTPRREGRRKGHSPYALAGVDLGQGTRPWYDVVLDALAA